MSQGSSRNEPSCPFHEKSAGTMVDGEIHNIHCEFCGDYRISDTALTMLEARVIAEPPKGWRTLVRRTPLISTRDMKLLAG